MIWVSYQLMKPEACTPPPQITLILIISFSSLVTRVDSLFAALCGRVFTSDDTQHHWKVSHHTQQQWHHSALTRPGVHPYFFTLNQWLKIHMFSDLLWSGSRCAQGACDITGGCGYRSGWCEAWSQSTTVTIKLLLLRQSVTRVCAGNESSVKRNS